MKPEYNYNKKQLKVHLLGVIAESCVGPQIPCRYRRGELVGKEESNSDIRMKPVSSRMQLVQVRMKVVSRRL